MMQFHPWTASELATLRTMFVAGKTKAEIAEALGRTVSAVVSKARSHNLRWKDTNHVIGHIANAEMMEEARRLIPPPYFHKSLTARLCGDPDPARSALGQKGQA